MNLKKKVVNESIRLVYRQDTAHVSLGVRSLTILTVLGAANIGFLTHFVSGTSYHRIGLWWLAVALADGFNTIVNVRYGRRERSDAELSKWGILKTASFGLIGCAWSLAPVLLAVAEEPGALMIAVGGIVNLLAAAVTVASCYAPAMIVTLLCLFLPAAALSAIQGGKLELLLTLCLLGGLPSILLIGFYAVRETRSGIEARLRIAELLRVQTRQAEQIRLARDERTRFFSSASHDLRQPLHALGLYLSLLPTAHRAEEREEISARLMECAGNLDQQFNAILNVARTDAEISSANIQGAHLGVSIDRVFSLFALEASRQGVTLRRRPTALWGEIAPPLFERVLGNLLSNAIKYSAGGRVLLAVRKIGRQARVYVIDTGVGINSENLDAIFRDFYQLDNPERNSEKGFGLGLGIVQRLCEGMNWKLSVRSTPGRGSMFAFDVPLTQPVVDPSRAAMTAASIADQSTGRSHGRRESILVIDDDPLVRDAMARLLTAWDLESVVVGSPDAAIAEIETRAPDQKWRALVDFRLGGHPDGLTLADQLRQRFGDRIQVLLMTGESDERLESGANARRLTIIRKPIKPIRLRAALAPA